MKRTLPFTAGAGRDATFDPSQNQNIKHLYKPSVFSTASGSEAVAVSCPMGAASSRKKTPPKKTNGASAAAAARRHSTDPGHSPPSGAGTANAVLGSFLAHADSGHHEAPRRTSNAVTSPSPAAQPRGGPAMAGRSNSPPAASYDLPAALPDVVSRHSPVAVDFKRSLSPRFTTVASEVAQHAATDTKAIQQLCQKRSKYVVALLSKPRAEHSSEFIADSYLEDEKNRIAVADKFHALRQEEDHRAPDYAKSSVVVNDGGVVMRPSVWEAVEKERAEKQKQAARALKLQQKQERASQAFGSPELSGFLDDDKSGGNASLRSYGGTAAKQQRAGGKKDAHHRSASTPPPTVVAFAREESLRDSRMPKGLHAKTPQPGKTTATLQQQAAEAAASGGDGGAGKPKPAAPPLLDEAAEKVRRSNVVATILFTPAVRPGLQGTATTPSPDGTLPPLAGSRSGTRERPLSITGGNDAKYDSAAGKAARQLQLNVELAMRTPEERERLRQQQTRDVPAHGFHSDVARKPPGNVPPLYDTGVVLSPERGDKLRFAAAPSPKLLQGLRFPSSNEPVTKADDPLLLQSKQIRADLRAKHLQQLKGDSGSDSSPDRRLSSTNMRQRIASIADFGALPLAKKGTATGSQLKAHADFSAPSGGHSAESTSGATGSTGRVLSTHDV